MVGRHRRALGHAGRRGFADVPPTVNRAPSGSRIPDRLSQEDRGRNHAALRPETSHDNLTPQLPVSACLKSRAGWAGGSPTVNLEQIRGVS